MPLQPPNKAFLLWSALGIGGFTILLSLPKAAENLKLTAQQNTRMSEQLGVITDKETGNIYGWIEGKNGEKRFVKMDKNSENKVRKERDENDKPVVFQISKKPNDVRSGKIFCRDSTYNKFEIGTCIKYRSREEKMLYKMEVEFAKNANSSQCMDRLEEKTLLNLINENDNKVRFRFVDADAFWLRDNLMPLNVKKANNYKTTVIDKNKDSCGKVNKLVFHGRLNKFSLPDYTWVEDGKLLFSGVTIIEAKEEAEED
tara:strand:+ start:183 stop:953 length:771 start_codon:yes stop_codon:yes gene_type:complete